MPENAKLYICVIYHSPHSCVSCIKLKSGYKRQVHTASSYRHTDLVRYIYTLYSYIASYIRRSFKVINRAIQDNRMVVFKAFVLAALMINIACSLPEQSSASGSAAGNTDRPVIVPKQILEKLIDISDKSKGLYLLWSNSFYLTKDRLLTMEVSRVMIRPCRASPWSLCMWLSIYVAI